MDTQERAWARAVVHQLRRHRRPCFLGMVSFLCLLALSQDAAMVLPFVSMWDVGARPPAIKHDLLTGAEFEEAVGTPEDVKKWQREWCAMEYGDRRYLNDKEWRVPPVLFSFPGDLD